jgi:hypothetical protein
MKNKVFLGIAIALLMSVLPILASAQPGFWYVGAANLPLEISGVEDIAVSDWQNYGLGIAEGRIVLPLSKGEIAGSQWGAVVGWRLPMHPRFSPLAEVQVGLDSQATLAQVFIGCDWKMMQMERFSLSLIPKIGWALGSVDFGSALVIPGKTAPVITPEGTIYNGDEVMANMAGMAYQVGVRANYMFTDRIGFNFDLGWTQAMLDDFTIEAGNVELDKNSPAVVKNDGSATQVDIDPQASSQGIVMTFGIEFLI